MDMQGIDNVIGSPEGAQGAAGDDVGALSIGVKNDGGDSLQAAEPFRREGGSHWQ